MAVRHGYGKIAGTDALVFAYDTGDTRNSYKGEPTVNLASNANFSNGTTNWNANQNVTLSVETVNGTRFLKVKSNQTTSTPGFLSDNITVSGNTTYTLTIRAYKNDSNSIWLYATGDGTGGSDIVWTSANGPNPITTELTTILRTFTTPSDMTYLRIGALWSTPLTTSEVYVEYMQLEQKSHATPFVNGTRSDTEGLKDLTGNSSINLSNVSFDSNAQMTFDGTGDFVDVDGIADFQPNNTTDGFTIEYIFKSETATSAVPVGNLDSTNGWFQAPISTGTDIGAYLYLNGSPGVVLRTNDNFYTNSENINKYHHVVMSLKWEDAANSFIMVNGVDRTATRSNVVKQSTSGIPSPGLRVGKRGSSIWPVNGLIPIIKYYNKALTAAEVRNNYRHYKNRFNI